jgi:hypothetical protein
VKRSCERCFLELFFTWNLINSLVSHKMNSLNERYQVKILIRTHIFQSFNIIPNEKPTLDSNYWISRLQNVIHQSVVFWLYGSESFGMCMIIRYILFHLSLIFDVLLITARSISMCSLLSIVDTMPFIHYKGTNLANYVSLKV